MALSGYCQVNSLKLVEWPDEWYSQINGPKGGADSFARQLTVMDLSETYRSIARGYFPNATIVADRFHVVRLINQ